MEERNSPLFQLTACEHRFCTPCLNIWFEANTSCPKCRQDVTSKDFTLVTGRALDSKQSAKQVPEEDIDEFSLHWLRENDARQCPCCGIWIIRYAGCNHVICRSCRCSFQFDDALKAVHWNGKSTALAAAYDAEEYAVMFQIVTNASTSRTNSMLFQEILEKAVLDENVVACRLLLLGYREKYSCILSFLLCESTRKGYRHSFVRVITSVVRSEPFNKKRHRLLVALKTDRRLKSLVFHQACSDGSAWLAKELLEQTLLREVVNRAYKMLDGRLLETLTKIQDRHSMLEATRIDAKTHRLRFFDACVSGDLTVVQSLLNLSYFSLSSYEARAGIGLALEGGHTEIAVEVATSVVKADGYFPNSARETIIPWFPLVPVAPACVEDLQEYSIMLQCMNITTLCELDSLWGSSSVVDIMMKACRENNSNYVRTLLQIRPDLLNSVDESGKSPLQHATLEGQTELIKLLLSRGARLDLEQLQYDTDTSMIKGMAMACLEGNLPRIRWMIHLFPSLLSRTTWYEGRSPSSFARAGGHRTIAEKLESWMAGPFVAA